MNRILALVFGLALLCGLPLFSTPADAYTITLCQPMRASVGGAGRYTAPTSGTTYSLDSRGCTLASSADFADFSSAGFVQGSPYRTAVAKGLTAADSSIVLPPSAVIQQIVVEEDSGGAVTGGIRIGTTANGNDVMLLTGVAANSVNTVEDVSMGLRAFSRTLPQQLFISTGSSFASSRVNVTVLYGYF